MINLYIFNETRLAAIYGVGTYIRELTAALYHSDLTVNMVNLKQDIPYVQIEEKEGIRFWSIPDVISDQRTIDTKKQNALYSRNIVFFLQLHIKDTTNLIFHLNICQTTSLTEELKKTFNCRIVATIHYFNWFLYQFEKGMRYRQISTSKENGVKYKISNDESVKDEKMFYEKFDHIICLSEISRQILLNDYEINKERISVIFNGLTDTVSVTDRQLLRQKYHIPDMPIFVFAGRIDEFKGLKYLIQSFKKVLTTCSQCHLIIAGDGAFDMYMKECEDIWMRVTWTGLINREKLYDLYAIADIGVMPSLYETFGYVAVEMMMHSLPVIATATSGLNEVVDDTCGLKIPVTENNNKFEIDTDILAEKMLFLLQHPEERQRLGANGRKRYETLFSGDVFRQNMLTFYHSLSEKTHPPNDENL